MMSQFVYYTPEMKRTVTAEQIKHQLLVKKEIPSWLLNDDFKSAFGFNGTSLHLDVLGQIATQVDVIEFLREYRLNKASSIKTVEPESVQKPHTRWSREDD